MGLLAVFGKFGLWSNFINLAKWPKIGHFAKIGKMGIRGSTFWPVLTRFLPNFCQNLAKIVILCLVFGKIWDKNPNRREGASFRF